MNETNSLTHIDKTGQARMVDVGNKGDTERIAIAQGEVLMQRSTLELIKAGLVKKGDVLTIAQVAGIMAAKRTSDLIPMCHPLPLVDIQLDLSMDEELPGVQIRSMVKTVAKTGVEMEALTAVAIAGLTVYDMAKAVEKTMRIQNIRLIKKTGGSSGVIINE